MTTLLGRPLWSLALLLCGAWLVLLGAYFMTLRPALLPEDLRYMRTTLPDITASLPGLGRWLRHVFVVAGGFMAATGVVTALIGYGAAPVHTRIATGVGLAITGLLSVIMMSAVNFLIRSAYKWRLLIPAILWVITVILYALDT